MKIHFIPSRDIPDLWFQAIHDVFEHGTSHYVDKGSYEGQTRLEYDYFIGHIKNPSYGSFTQDIIPQIPPHIDIPAPVELGYIYGGDGYERSYVEYVMTDVLQPNESYTYGSRLRKMPVRDYKCSNLIDMNSEIADIRAADIDNRNALVYDEIDGEMYVDQIEWVINVYKNFGYWNNQMVLQIAHPTDCTLVDPPCLRHIDTRISDGKLHFIIYFRSWDLWNGLPANLPGIEALHAYMASEIGVEQGEFIVESKGLHLYGYAEDLAKLRLLKG